MPYKAKYVKKGIKAYLSIPGRAASELLLGSEHLSFGRYEVKTPYNIFEEIRKNQNWFYHENMKVHKNERRLGF